MERLARLARSRGRTLVVALALAVGVGCGRNHATPGGPGVVVEAALTEWRIDATPATVPAGRVSFVARNDGVVMHELAVIRTDAPLEAILLTNGRASEAGLVGKVRSVAPGHTVQATVLLPAGRYALICNIFPYHYRDGMATELTVTASEG